VIAAEDDEFCIRVRAQGWKILQLDAEMARHDINMTHFSEWWRRSKRTGHAFAQVASLHGRGEERYFVPDIQRIWTWALVLPLLALVLAPVTRGWSLLLLALAYGLQFARTYQRSRKRWIPRDALIYATFTALFKFSALIGLIEYYWRHRRGDAFTIIEYRRSS